MGFVYILLCVDGKTEKYYVGQTKRHVQDRLDEHVEGKSKWTSTFQNVHLSWCCEVENWMLCSIEHHLKKNRYLVYGLVGKKPSPERIQNFEQWLHDNYGRVVKNDENNWRVIKNE